MNETNSTPRFCSRPLRKLAISPMTCNELISGGWRAGAKRTNLVALRIAVVEAWFERNFEAELDGVVVEELLESGNRRRR